MNEGHRRRNLVDLDPSSLKELAKQTLGATLNANRPAISGIRSYWQHRALYAGKPTEEMYTTLGEISNEVKRLSNGLLESGSGALCQLSDTGLIRKHDAEGFTGNAGKLRAVRGLWILMKAEGFLFEAVIMDGGRSRTFFDDKSPEEKEAFPQGYIQAERKGFHPYFDLPSTPPPFFGLVGDDSKTYTVEQMTSMRERILTREEIGNL